MALVSGQLVRSRRFDLDRQRGPAIQRGPQHAAPIHRRPGAARRVVQLERRITFARPPRLRLRAAREDLGAGRRDERAGGVAGSQGREELGQLQVRVGTAELRDGVDRKTLLEAADLALLAERSRG